VDLGEPVVAPGPAQFPQRLCVCLDVDHSG
jgi:hypothetical protein